MAEKNVLFELVDDLFSCQDVTQKYTDETFKQYQFMINRIISIKYPIEASKLNFNGINPKYSAYTLNWMLYNGKGKEPWVFTKGSKKIKEDSASKKKISPKLIRDYCSWYNKDVKDVEFALKLFGEEAEKELIEFDEMLNKKNEK